MADSQTIPQTSSESTQPKLLGMLLKDATVVFVGLARILHQCAHLGLGHRWIAASIVEWPIIFRALSRGVQLLQAFTQIRSNFLLRHQIYSGVAGLRYRDTCRLMSSQSVLEFC